MPNLNQIYSLKEKYSQITAEDLRIKDYLEKTKANDTIQKAFSSGILNERVRETRSFSLITESLNPSKPELIRYFEEAKEEDVALLFIDITGFSRTIQGWTNSQIKKYLDDYYERIIPIIYKYGGEIEKLMGDGIICLFGKPFLKLDHPRHVYKAEECAKAVIEEFNSTDKIVKVAIHTGVVNYYKVPGEYYGEYTIIGQPITDLYRLESVSKSNAINFFKESDYDRLGWGKSFFNKDDIFCDEFEIPELQGVEYLKIGVINTL